MVSSEVQRIYIIAPLLNERSNVPGLLKRWGTLREVCPEYQASFVVVDDGSTDGTKAAIEESMGDLDVVVLRHDVNIGPGAGFASAFEFLAGKVCETDVVVTMEGDNTSSIKALSVMVERMNREGFDAVLASPYAYGGGFVGTGMVRLLLSAIANLVFKACLSLNGFHTISSFFRVFTGAAIIRLQLQYGARIVERTGFEAMTELLMKMVKERLTISEMAVPLDSSARRGKSKMKIFRTVRGYFELFADRLLHRKGL